MDPTLLTAVGGTAVFGTLTWQQWRWVRRARASVAWPRVRATVRHANAVTVEGTARGGRFRYRASVVRYSYRVAGRRYSGRRLRFGLGTMVIADGDHSLGHALARGDVILVAVDPAEPTLAVLEPGARLAHYVELGVCGLGAALCALWALGYSVA